MKPSRITAEFLSTLGQAVLDFGAMESIVRTALLVLSRQPSLAKVLIPPGNAVSQNLELLRRLCHSRVQPKARGEWLRSIDDIHELFQERNRIFHGMFYERDEKLFIAKSKRGKRGNADERLDIEFDIASVPSALERLKIRRRQLMDFVDDYRDSDDGPAHTPSQEVHASLSVKDDA